MVSRNNRPLVAVLLGLTLVRSASQIGRADETAPVLSETRANRLFTLKILPLLKDKCFGCHGRDPEDIRADYDLLTRAKMIRGGESGKTALVPGKPQDSPLYRALLWDGYEMPPKETDRLSKEETEYFSKWIAAGAPLARCRTSAGHSENRMVGSGK